MTSKRPKRLILDASKCLLLIPVLLLNGCIIFPHYQTITPALTGRVHRNAQPIENASVYIGSQSPCDKSRLLVHTNSEGKFSVERKRKLQYMLVMDPAYNFGVCIGDGDRRYQAWNEGGLGHPPGYMTLDCDLANQQLNSNRRGSGICSDITQYKKPNKTTSRP